MKPAALENAPISPGERSNRFPGWWTLSQGSHHSEKFVHPHDGSNQFIKESWRLAYVVVQGGQAEELVRRVGMANRSR